MLPTQSDDEEVRSVRSEAVKEVVEFNKKLALQRRLQHCSYHDGQTQVSGAKLFVYIQCTCMMPSKMQLL